ncbi:hypothetical protein RHMOL_Rhmol10G0250300 [Rhododendron molle]|uniref:Uncharacterized protein n=1 Tax=Rhododendron molle TaxID=49168 RepID=A0ACC0M6Y4_RHOML|nr:hypothetical protein RHMOL_Rhmol10G0250300 [Rhododendron molle]
MPSNGAATAEEAKQPLLDYSSATVQSKYGDGNDDLDLAQRVWIESKKLWHIVGPSMFSRLTTYSMLVITQAFAGHLGDHELAAVSIATNVVVGFNFGLLLGMASALETLCGQAFGAKKYHMLGIYMQRSWIVLFLCCILLLPLYLFASPILKLLGQPSGIAELSGVVSLWMIPLHFSFAFQFPLQSLENWYYRILILMTGNLKNAEVAVDALSICMNINGWEMMIPLAFFAGTGVRVANELGAGNGKGAKFATTVSVTTSAVIGVAIGSGWQAYVAYINLSCYYLIGVPLGFLMGWVFDQGVMGIWAGMIFGGTAVQTLILAIITIRCDWENEAEKATAHVNKWNYPHKL